MRVATLPYRIIFGTRDLLPLCDVQVLGPRGRARVTSVLDTGAVYSVFPARVAEDVGLPLPKSPNFTIQYGGSVTFGRRIRGHIELEQRRLDTEIVFVERLDLPYGLLGRRGIFSRFNEVVFLEKVRTPRVELRW
jgi:predicted aspartyl protease